MNLFSIMSLSGFLGNWCFNDYEHIRFAGPKRWLLLHQLFQDFFDKFSVCDELKVGVILPLFKGKGAKANNKDNYRGITLFPTSCKIYEMILFNRLEKYAAQIGLFSEMKFGFQDGVDCTEYLFGDKLPHCK